jgi:hypothetical protein
MRATHLFLFMSLVLGTVSVSRAEDPSANPPVEHPPVANTAASPAPTITKDETPDSVTTSVTKMKSKKKAKKKKKEALPEKPIITEVTVPMAKGELEAEVAANQAQRERANAPHTSFELAVSTWKPKRATTFSRIPGTTDFDTKGIPYLEADVFSPLFGRHDLHVEGGIGFLAMHRSGTITSTGLSVPQDENGYVLSLRVGVVYSPYKFYQDRLTPYVEAAAMPSLVVTRESSFDQGQSDTGIPFEIGLGAFGTLSKSLSLDVGVTETLGKVETSDFNKFAVRAGLRVAL